MRRAGFSPEQELERVYKNMMPEYTTFIRRQDFRTLTELTYLGRGGRAIRGYKSGG